MKSWQMLLTAGLVLQFNAVYPQCNVCQENQVACINSTSFYLCFGEDTPNTEVLYHCKDGFDCTGLNAICVQKSNSRPPSCGDTSLCGMCSAHRNFVFACQSRTTFQMCYGAVRPSGQIGYCPTGTVCDANSDSICVSTDQPFTITCDVVDPEVPTEPTSTTQTSTSTTTEQTPLTPNETCAQMREVGLFPTMPNDPFCRRYIHCYFTNGIIRGIEYTCSANSYFNIENEVCSFYKPTYCI